MIRSYGPGKFNSVVDSYVYTLSLEGWNDDELGEAAYFGYYARLPLGQEAVAYIRKEFAKDKERKPVLTEEETELLRGSAGAIVHENDQGFVDVAYYDDEQLDRVWAALEKDYMGFEEEAEGLDEE